LRNDGSLRHMELDTQMTVGRMIYIVLDDVSAERAEKG
jgi:hypothetical protein